MRCFAATAKGIQQNGLAKRQKGQSEEVVGMLFDFFNIVAKKH